MSKLTVTGTVSEHVRGLSLPGLHEREGSCSPLVLLTADTDTHPDVDAEFHGSLDVFAQSVSFSAPKMTEALTTASRGYS